MSDNPTKPAKCPLCDSPLNSPQPEKLLYADLELSLGTRIAWRGDYKVKLTDREFHGLVFLMRNADRIVTRADIMAGAWGKPYAGLTNGVDVYVNYLRLKIDKGFNPLIHTVRGRGYVFGKAPANQPWKGMTEGRDPEGMRTTKHEPVEEKAFWGQRREREGETWQEINTVLDADK